MWVVKIENPEEVFETVSGWGSIFFTEFSEWAIKLSLDLEDDEDYEDPDSLK
jgi:hypothetical protein